MRVAVVCFANTCRSPVAEAYLARFLQGNPGVSVFSRGLAGGPGITPEAMQTALHERGLGLVSASGERLVSEDLDADLYLFMERAILREAVVRHPALWPRSFTMREFARRAQLNPPQPSAETFEQWLALLHSTRTRDELLGVNPLDDVSDPGLGGDVLAFESMIDDLESLSHKVAQFLSGWPTR